MGKTANTRHSQPKQPDDIEPIRAQADPSLSAEQLHRYQLLLEFLREKEENYAKLSDEEKRQAEDEWELFKKSMNESHAGYRIPYPD